MAAKTVQIPLNAAEFAFSYKAAARSVAESTDLAPRMPGAFFGSVANAEFDVPQLLYCENVLPLAGQLFSVGYGTQTAAFSPAVTDFDQAFTLRDASVDGRGLQQDFSDADWRATDGGVVLTWATEDFATNESANAIRWGTLYNFRFDCDVPPESGQVQLGIFKPGTPAFVSVAAMTPILPHCPGDFNHDGGVDFFDYLDFVQAFSEQLPSADFNLDGVIDFFDYLDFVEAFQAGC